MTLKLPNRAKVARQCKLLLGHCLPYVAFSLLRIDVNFLRHHDEHYEQHRDNNVDREQPAEKGEVGRYDRSEVGLNFLDARFPRYQIGGQIGQLPQ